MTDGTCKWKVVSAVSSAVAALAVGKLLHQNLRCLRKSSHGLQPAGAQACGATHRADAVVQVVVTSSNPEKLAAVQQAFEQSLDKEVGIDASPAESGIPHGQPWGMQHTYEGCAARLQHLRASLTGGHNYSYLVSVENGVIPIVSHTGTSGHDIACVIVENVQTGAVSFAFSQSRPYPLEDVQRLKREGKSNQAIGGWCKTHYGAIDLTHSRLRQIKDCTMLVLSSM
eukprot:TRINITY_DN110666_c0_g1_i1.p1 TRINITY_DN110666_c0_g1~~TRINITY_DN110666_c0_g1_i1.p1  ORF type:complete len:227 (-),score=30.64 TRINITY_DN110666_c0_g1_i1:274-954(-)